jgi:hypothetical protein
MPGVLCVVDVQEKLDNVLAAADDDNGKADDDDNGKAGDDNGKADDDDNGKETPFVPLIGDDARVIFGPVPPPRTQPRNYTPTFGKRGLEASEDESEDESDIEEVDPKTKKRFVCCRFCRFAQFSSHRFLQKEERK